ncbi:MAG: hypothetical protein PHV42_02720 [Candidatus Pacebacteria bacterium]|nr:hypothetical protein [Candidatus Paceibacterota bacterium]
MKLFLKRAFFVAVYIFAAIGFFLVSGYFAVKYGLTNEKGIIDNSHQEFIQAGIGSLQDKIKLSWTDSEEWQIFKTAAAKDTGVLVRVEGETGVPRRLIVGALATEQLRLFFTEREFFKQAFSPLKILGNQSQFSWGVMGIKEETAVKIEKNLKDPTSPFYLGKEWEHTLDFKTNNPDEERYERLVNEHDHYYSYLYAALYFKEIEEQWQNAGFPIANRPEILGTLFNIGFENSKPNGHPDIGGAEISLNGEIWSFGSIAGAFYYSDELTNEFPIEGTLL